MIDTPSYLENHELVLQAFGYWPSFHDAEIHTLIMDRTRILVKPMFNPRIELLIHCWEMTKELDSKGFYKLNKHHLVRFEFDMVHELKLADFNQQNAVFGLLFEEVPKEEGRLFAFKVIIEPAFGLNGEFQACAGRVLSVTPYGS